MCFPVGFSLNSIYLQGEYMKKTLTKIFVCSIFMFSLLVGCENPSAPSNQKDNNSGNTDDTSSELTVLEQINENIKNSGIARNISINGNIGNIDCLINLIAGSGTFEAYKETKVSRSAVNDSLELIFKGEFFYNESSDSTEPSGIYFEVTDKADESGTMTALTTKEYYQAESDLSAINETALFSASDENTTSEIFEEAITVETNITGTATNQEIYQAKKTKTQKYIDEMLANIKKTVVVELPQSVGECPFVVGKSFYYDAGHDQSQSFTYKGLGVAEINMVLDKNANLQRNEVYKCTWNAETKTLYMALIEVDGKTYEDLYALVTDSSLIKPEIKNIFITLVKKSYDVMSKEDFLDALELSKDFADLPEDFADLPEEELLEIVALKQLENMLLDRNIAIPENATEDDLLQLYLEYCYQNNQFQSDLDQFNRKYVYDYSTEEGIVLTRKYPTPFTLGKLIEDFDDYMFHTYDMNRQYNLALTNDELIMYYGTGEISTHSVYKITDLNEEAETIKATSVSNVSGLLPNELNLTYIIRDGFDENYSTRRITITFTDTATRDVYSCYNVVGNDVVRYTLTVEP